ncbi:delta-aminolevulinic acid dehydratases (porphobilinogen synthase) [Legionella busanensis]|uniref:Delta-aminolevulinic acid dehydratase n=1 Tax=Legionella busanensis TaxID=190655 RepID=A0A378JIS9_9GAMM|nr:porphobilinogen synthase [Legionella busanensis]STX50967.1 delta-aminolevulinic acid dehydratases (porphobilinogen synthase) [Legionella busanensis]
MHQVGHFPKTRLRRLRRNETIRGLTREIHLNIDKLVLPLFIKYGSGKKEAIPSMPGHFQLSVDKLEEEINEILSLDIKSMILFGIPSIKNQLGTDSYSDDGIIQKAIKLIKKIAPHLLIISDICLCEYTDHGHCGFVSAYDSHHVEIDNDKTIELLAKQAVSHVKAGTDIIAPSANMDGMVSAIRGALDNAGFYDIPILSYAVKYASSMYGPFRQAAEGAPKFGDRRTYQMDFANGNEALRECLLDIEEGADMLMVKPAHTYLDIIFRVKSAYPEIPLGAYHTSGEFAMIKAATEKGWIVEQGGVIETLTAIQRAGADFIISYFTKEVAQWLKDKA